MKAYPDQPQLEDTPNQGELTGERDQSVALISDTPGRFDIPELHLTWWNTRTNRPEEVVLPARTLSVLPAAGGGVVAPNRAQSSPAPSATLPLDRSRLAKPAVATTGTRTDLRGPWPWISLGLAVLWVGTLVAWWRTTRRRHRRVSAATDTGSPDGSSSAAQARSAFLDACQSNDPAAARRHLIAWVNLAGYTGRVRGLNELARKINDPASTPLLQELDRACYVGGPWDGSALKAAITRWPKSRPTPARSDTELRPLYR
jgi:hypothetical protein